MLKRVAKFVSPIAMMTTLLVMPTQAWAAVGCTGAACDNQGPKGNGCFADKKTIATNGASGTYSLRLYYSPDCHAVWGWTGYRSYFWSNEIHLEMEEKVDGRWVHRKRLIQTKKTDEITDWTNALGARKSTFRFRALWVDTHDSPAIQEATPWTLGGGR